MALNYVLFVAVFLGLVIGAHSQGVNSHIRTARQVEAQVQARLLAQSGLEIAKRALLAERPGTLPAPFTLALADGQVSIFFQDESGKADANKAPLDLIALALASAGLADEEQKPLFAAISRARAKEERFKSLQEIGQSAALSKAIVEKVSGVLTVHSDLLFVDADKASPVFARALRKKSDPAWTGVAGAVGYHIIVTSKDKSGFAYTLSAVYKPGTINRPEPRLVELNRIF